MRRRRFLGYGLAAGCAALTSRLARSDDRPPAVDRHHACFPGRRRRVSARLAGAICNTRLAAPSPSFSGGSYREVSELLLAEKLDAAWICGFPYVRYHDRMRLLAVPDLRRRAAVSLLRDRAQQRYNDAIDRRPGRKDLRLLRSRFELGLARAELTAVPARQGSPRRFSARPFSPGAIAASSMPSRLGSRKEVRSMAMSGTRCSSIIPNSRDRRALRTAPPNTAFRRL